MNNKLILLGIVSLAVGGVVFAPQAVLAYRGDPTIKGPNYTEERHVAMKKVFESKDYNAWKTLMVGRGRVVQVINAQNFARFAEAHELAEQGNVVGANKIRVEMGLGFRNGKGRGQGMGYGFRNR